MKQPIILIILLLTTIISAQNHIGKSKTFKGSELISNSITVNAGMPQMGSSKKGGDYFVMVSGYEGKLLIAYVENPNPFTCKLAKKLITPNKKVTLYGRFKDDKLFIFDKIEVRDITMKLSK